MEYLGNASLPRVISASPEGSRCVKKKTRYHVRLVEHSIAKKKTTGKIAVTLQDGKVHKERSSHGKPAATKVGLKPKRGWHKRNFVTQVLIPSIFTRRSGHHARLALPKLNGTEIGVTWIGHASFLVQAGGMNILIDPIWAKWLKVVKRVKHPGIPLPDLPSINLVLVTHAHFDHLDRKTLRKIAGEQPIIVPFEVGSLVHDLGFSDVHELDYWKSINMGPLKITLTPCHHWGARLLHDTHRGFGGFVIETEGRAIYHCGDTAYFPGFKEIGKHFQIEIAMMPIGAYDPPSGREVHMNPEESVQAFIDLRAKKLIPMHYGSFRLGFEPLHEPLERLMVCAKKRRIQDKIVVMSEGLPRVF